MQDRVSAKVGTGRGGCYISAIFWLGIEGSHATGLFSFADLPPYPCSQPNASAGGTARRAIDEGNKRPASVKASLSVAMGQRAPNRAGAREEGRGMGSELHLRRSVSPHNRRDERQHERQLDDYRRGGGGRRTERDQEYSRKDEPDREYSRKDGRDRDYSRKDVRDREYRVRDDQYRQDDGRRGGHGSDWERRQDDVRRWLGNGRGYTAVLAL
jgi:pre-mRNA-splicing factor 38B